MQFRNVFPETSERTRQRKISAYFCSSCTKLKQSLCAQRCHVRLHMLGSSHCEKTISIKMHTMRVRSFTAAVVMPSDRPPASGKAWRRQKGNVHLLRKRRFRLSRNEVLKRTGFHLWRTDRERACAGERNTQLDIGRTAIHAKTPKRFYRHENFAIWFPPEPLSIPSDIQRRFLFPGNTGAFPTDFFYGDRFPCDVRSISYVANLFHWQRILSYTTLLRNTNTFLLLSVDSRRYGHAPGAKSRTFHQI